MNIRLLGMSHESLSLLRITPSVVAKQRQQVAAGVSLRIESTSPGRSREAVTATNGCRRIAAQIGSTKQDPRLTPWATGCHRFAVKERRAVTLLEVVFSMGVILIGLLGLLSILPLAGRRAQQSVSLSVGTAIGEQMVNELEARRYLADGRLRPVLATTASIVNNLSYPPPPPVPPATATQFTSYCLDPMFASSSAPPAMPIANGYTGAAFPYYKVNHNPLLDPSTDPALNPWPAVQPRLTRVGITRENNPLVLLNVSEALEIAEASDDLFVTRPDDRTLNARFSGGEVPAVPSGLEYGKRIPRGDFTWIATVNPLPGNQYASISIVTMRKRIRNFATPTATAAPSTPAGNGVGERLAYVTYASGFSGGAGGTVHLVSNANTVSNLKSDDWIMLSRAVPTASGNVAYHRWYRVVGVNGEAEEIRTTGGPGVDDAILGCKLPTPPGAPGYYSVWRHKVQLDGSDWAFGFADAAGNPRAYADFSFDDNTFATIVPDVVSVTERIVLLSDL